MKDLMKIIIFVLIGLNVTVPCVLVKMTYFDATKKRVAFERQLDEIRKKNVSISALINEPKAVIGLQQELNAEIQVLSDLMPPKSEMIAAQKFLSQFAREVDVVIVALRPAQDSVPLEFAPEETEDTVKGKKKKVEPKMRSTGVNTALIELKVKGSYEHICSYISMMEECKEVNMIVNSLAMTQVPEEGEVIIQADIGVKIFYSV
jgi:hypothetical protein